MPKITKRLLSSISPAPKDVFIRDTDLPGFGIKVSPKGTVSFIAEARIKRGKTKRVTLGKHPILPLDKARKKAQETLLVMKDGFDPIELEEEERKQRAKLAAVNDAKQITLRTVFDEYQTLRDLKPKTLSDYKSTFNVCLADWLEEPVPNITRRAVEQRFIKVRDNQGKGQAAKCMRILAAVLNHAKAYEVDDGVRLITENPCDVLKEKKVDRKLKPRERFLDRQELRLVVEELSHVQHPAYSSQPNRLNNVTVADFLTLLLFTGLRREEAATLEWGSINFMDGYFVVHDTKNRSDHVVPMSQQVRAVLERRRDAGDRHEQWVFPNRRRNGPLREPRKQLEKLEEITGVKFTCHDLRRTFATLAESYGVDYHSIKRALNHKAQDITERYIQTRVDKMRHVFDAVAEEIVWWTYDEPASIDQPTE
jgi:integrase